MSNLLLAWTNAVPDGATFTNYPASVAIDGDAPNMAAVSLSKRWVSRGLTGAADAQAHAAATGHTNFAEK